MTAQWTQPELPFYEEEEAKQYNESDLWEQYKEWLDEQEEITIGYLTYSVSQVLEAVDPIAFRVGFNDYIDFMEISDDQIKWGH